MTSHPSGSDSSASSRTTTCRCRNPEARRGHGRADAPAVATPVTAVICPASALDLRPGLRPLRVVDTDVAATVQAVCRRRRPVGDLVGERLVVRVEGGAVVLVGGVRARLRLL